MGTPSTEPSGTAEKITAVARPACASGTSREARLAPMDQKAPMTSPTRTRETIISQ